MTSATETLPVKSSPAIQKEESQFSVVFWRFRRHRLAVLSLILLTVILLASLLAPVITTYPRDAVDVSTPNRPAPPGVSGTEGQVSRTLDGDTLRSFTREFTPLPVTEAEKEQAHEDLEWFIREYGGTVDWSEIPDHKPATEDFFFDNEGNIWVVPVAAADKEWRVVEIFDPEGRYLGRVDLPFRLARPYPVIRNDMMYAVIQDEMEVPYVVRARIEKPD